MATTSTPKTATVSPARKAGRGSKSTATTTAPVAKPSGASDAPKPKRVSLAELLATHAPKATSAPDLAKLCGVPDDEAFRRSVTHHAQGRRALAAYKAKLIVDGDSKVYRERHGKAAEKAETSKPKPTQSAA
jgi:hypothetical protein